LFRGAYVANGPRPRLSARIGDITSTVCYIDRRKLMMSCRSCAFNLPMTRLQLAMRGCSS